MNRFVAAVFMLALLPMYPTAGVAQPVQARSGEAVPSLAPMLEGVMPAVVSISVKGRVSVQQNPLLSDPFFQQFFGLPDQSQPMTQEFQAAGSGVVVDARNGYVVTNNHVIENANDISITFGDGKELSANLVGTDPQTDIAVLKVRGDGMQAIEFGDSDALRVGDYVVAVGNPFGLSQTVTSGIVSALGRAGLGIERYENFIQTDASINPGNSGGALVDLKGRLVGINTAIVSGSGGSVGIGFAIPANLMRDVMQQLVASGRVSRGQLGVAIQDLTPDLAKALNTTVSAGAVIASVEAGSAADKAGLKPGDIVTRVDGTPIRSASELSTKIGLMHTGDNVHVELLRDGKTITVEAQLQEATAASRTISPASLLSGVTFSDSSNGGGVIVASVSAGSKAQAAGLMDGDVVVSANRQQVTSPDQLIAIADRSPELLLLQVKRGSSEMLVVLK